MENSKKVDPGWNDPPMLNYSASNPPPKSRITNKRVAFPLSGQSSGPLDPNKPPPSIPIAKTDVQLYSTAMANLDQILASTTNEEIKEKLGNIKKMWDEGLFTGNVQQKICDLLECINNKDFMKANELQLKLMIEAQSVCGSWLSAVRQLISNQQ